MCQINANETKVKYRMRYLVEDMKMQKESRIATEEIGTQI